MGLRAKLKNTVKKLVLGSKKNSVMHESSEDTSKDVVPEQKNTAPSEINKSKYVSERKNISPMPKEEAQHTAPKPEKGKSDPTEDKVLRHRRKARLGLLRFVSEKDGCVDLATLHKQSEMRYFIGHQSFSTLMEEMVEDGVFHFDWEESKAYLTEKGRLEIAS